MTNLSDGYGVFSRKILYVPNN